MNIAIIGSGYVGLVTGTCFAEIGNNVICADNNKQKIARLKRNETPNYEPYLQDLVKRNTKEKRLTFTTSTARAIQQSDIVLNCVGTPLNKKKLPDLVSTYEVAKLFAENLNSYKIFINKSTVPPGTTLECKKIIEKNLKTDIKGAVKPPFDVASNPEFLRQGTAVKDFMTPDRIIVGTENEKTKKVLNELYSPIIRTGKPIIFTDLKTAELIKYAANAFIATKISFINDLAVFSEKNDINIREISRAIGLDNRIGPRYLHAGLGFGGGCLTKDIQSLISLGKENNHRFKLLEEVSSINKQQRKHLIKKIKKHLPLKGKTIAIWGLSYKPKTDDLRDSPVVEIVNALLQSGAKLNLFDPVANHNAKKILPKTTKIKYFEQNLQAVNDADALIILTEWDEFRAVNLNKVKKLMKGNIIFDGRNIVDPEAAKQIGFKYLGIGVK